MNPNLTLIFSITFAVALIACVMLRPRRLCGVGVSALAACLLYDAGQIILFWFSTAVALLNLWSFLAIRRRRDPEQPPESWKAVNNMTTIAGAGLLVLGILAQVRGRNSSS